VRGGVGGEYAPAWTKLIKSLEISFNTYWKEIFVVLY